jgi:hypothetical protein
VAFIGCEQRPRQGMAAMKKVQPDGVTAIA